MSKRAFTIIELLIIMGIIAILIGLIVVGLQSMQAAGARTQSVNALRQMVAGYIGYSTDNRNQLMPGYVDFNKLPAALKDPADAKFDARRNLLMNAKLPFGEWVVTHDTEWDEREMLQSYVWRLAPYVDHNWRTMMVDYREAGAERHLQGTFDKAFTNDQYTNPDALIDISMLPAYGLNSIFLGGDNRHGGTVMTDKSPWENFPNVNDDKIAATRMTEVLNPANMIVFGAAAMAHPDVGVQPDIVYATTPGIAQPRGYPELRPPFLFKNASDQWTRRQWLVGKFGEIQAHTNLENLRNAGLPMLRHGAGNLTRGGYLPIGNLDGSARADDILSISTDMRRWSPFETGINPPPLDAGEF